MKKINYFIFIFLIVICLASASLAGYYYASSDTGDDYSDITFWWGCKSTSIDHTDGEDSTASLNSDAAINSDAGIIGTNGLDCPTNYDFATLTDSTDGAWPTSSFRLGFYFNSNTWTDGCWFVHKRYDANNRFYAKRASGSEIYINYKWSASDTVTLTSSGAGLDSGEHFIELIVDDDTNLMQILVDGVSKGSQNTAISAFTAGGEIKIGEPSGCGESVDAYFDNVIISNDITRDLNALKNLTSYPGS